MKIRMLIGLAAAAVLSFGMRGITEEKLMEEKRQYSPSELAILDDNGTPQERIERGALLPSEERLLKVLAHAQDYMAQRYPQEEFVFTRIDHSMPAGTDVLLLASSVKTPQESFAVSVRGKKPPYEMSESYFSDLKREEANDLVKSVFAGMGIEAACSLEISGLFGDAHDPALSVEQMLRMGLRIPIAGWVYVMADAGADLETVTAAVLDTGLTGGFDLYAVHGTSLEARSDASQTSRMGYVSLPARKREVE